MLSPKNTPLQHPVHETTTGTDTSHTCLSIAVEPAVAQPTIHPAKSEPNSPKSAQLASLHTLPAGQSTTRIESPVDQSSASVPSPRSIVTIVYRTSHQSIACIYCSKIFSHKSSLFRHIKTVHYAGRGFVQCQLCEQR